MKISILLPKFKSPQSRPFCSISPDPGSNHGVCLSCSCPVSPLLSCSTSHWGHTAAPDSWLWPLPELLKASAQPELARPYPGLFPPASQKAWQASSSWYWTLSIFYVQILRSETVSQSLSLCILYKPLRSSKRLPSPPCSIYKCLRFGMTWVLRTHFSVHFD